MVVAKVKRGNAQRHPALPEARIAEHRVKCLGQWLGAVFSRQHLAGDAAAWVAKDPRPITQVELHDL